MTPSVEHHENPEHVLDVAGAFLASRPAHHNLILTLLQARVAVPEPGRYWVVADADGDGVVGVAFQSPFDRPATVTPVPAQAVGALVAEIARTVRELPGVSGDAGTAAGFAGHWTEHRRVGARPADGQRIYQLDELVRPTGVSGTPRRAAPADRDLLIEWLAAFEKEAGAGIGGGDLGPVVDRRLAAGQFWIWDDGAPVSLVAHTDAAAGVARIQAVYTPPDRRGRGYAAASVAALSARLVEAGHRCVLYTDLANPTSNAVYRRIGYRAVAECLTYRFG